jgi:hypothetical protein
MQATRPAPRSLRLGIACALLALAAAARAAEASFTASLSSEEASLAGIPRLSASQVAILDALIAQDMRVAHEGGVTGFSTGFSARHWETQRDASGLDRLSADQRAALDADVARLIALGPPPDQPFSYSPPAKVVSVAPSPVQSLVSAVKHAEVHGDLSLTVGAGSHGSSFYGTSMDVNVTDPTGHFTLGLGFEQFRGKGLIGLCGPDGLYGPEAYGPPYLGW